MINLKNHMHSVSSKLFYQVTGLAVLACAITGGAMYSASFSSIENYIHTDIAEYTEIESQELGLTLGNYATQVQRIAADDRMKSMDFAKQQELMYENIDYYGYNGMSVADTTGKLYIFNGMTADVSDVESFQLSIRGEVVVGDPRTDIVDDTRSFIPLEVPIYNNNREIVGRLAADLKTDFISEHLNDVKRGETGYSILLNSKGDIITTNKVEFDFAANPYNILEVYEGNDSAINAYNTILSSEENGFVEFSENGQTKYVGYSKIPNSNWILATITDRNEIVGPLDNIRFMFIMATGFSILIAVALSYIISIYFKKPLQEINNFAKSLAENDLTHKININRKDEFGDVANMLNDAMSNLQSIVKTVKNAEETTLGLINSTNDNINVVNSMIQNVAAGTEEISSSMQESSASIEEITTQIINAREFGNIIDEQSKKNALVAQDIQNMSKQIIIDTEKSKEEIFHKYESAKERLNGALKKVEVISQINVMAETINNIASQTNLLSLNASIEAARAGDAGKGFSVVAEEVRKLAEESAKTASGIQQVMSNVIESVGELTSASKEVLDAMKNTSDESYEKMVTISSEYSSTGETIGEMTSKLEQETSKIANALNDIVENVTSLSTAIEAVSSNSDTIAHDVSNISNEIQALAESSRKNIEVSSELSKHVNNFNVK